jgi:ABC-type uncharacterized transport system auxiliary subunit
MKRLVLHRCGTVLLLAALAFAGGCALVATQPKVTIHTLKTTVPSTAQGETVPWHLAVDRVRGSEIYSSTRILAMPRPGELQVYPETQWSDPPMNLFGALSQRALERDGRIGGVSPSGQGLAADLELKLELTDFQIEPRDEGLVAHVAWQANLVGVRENRITAARRFEAWTSVAGGGASEAVAAFDAALAQLLPEQVDWVVEQGQRYWDARR